MMAISETKMKIVIANYFKDECDVNTSIRQAFEKGFRIGVKKGASTNRPQGKWKPKNHHTDYCSECGFEETQWHTSEYRFCPSCGARMKGVDDEHLI
jgi:NADH pyrophosphatase NudC (nudix superfamily)